ncbi:MAG: SHOCT domain-containing protein [Desulfovibrionaceae bacterium]|nr:SHOCT domain-containing protein [Desulfovibrionaceae bacterium]
MSQWDFWPFGPGYGQNWTLTLAKAAYVAVILGLILLFLRFLFGPKGVFRDKELEREAEEEKKKALEELELDFAAGRIEEFEYRLKKRSLKK